MPYFIALFILLISFKTIAINQDQLISENDLYYLFKNSLKKWNENVIFLDKKKSMAKITTNNNGVYSLKSTFKEGSIIINPLYKNNLVNKININYDLRIYDDFLINLIVNHYKNIENKFFITIDNTQQKIKIKIEKYN